MEPALEASPAIERSSTEPNETEVFEGTVEHLDLLHPIGDAGGQQLAILPPTQRESAEPVTLEIMGVYEPIWAGGDESLIQKGFGRSEFLLPLQAQPSFDLPVRLETPTRPRMWSAPTESPTPPNPGFTPQPSPAPANQPVPPATTAAESSPPESGGGGSSTLDGGECDCEPVPLVRIQAVDPTAATWTRTGGAQGTSTGAFEVWRTGDIGETLTVWYTVSPESTAIPGSDYAPLDGFVDIPAGQRSAGILVEPLTANENAVKSVTITLDWSFDYLGDGAGATVTLDESISPEMGFIYSNWELPAVGIEALDPNAAELLEEPSTGIYLVSRYYLTIYGPQQGGEEAPDTYTNSDPVTVNYTVFQPPEQASGDYETLPGSVTLGGGVFGAEIKLTPIDDLALEGDEWVTVTLTESSNYTIMWLANQATVTIKDNDRPNQAPVAYDDEYEVTWNSTEELLHELDVEDPGVLANDYDPDGDPLYVVSFQTPAHAAEFSWCACGGFYYVPEEGFVGEEVVTYTVSDGIDYDTATVTIDVVNHAPIGVDDSYTVWSNTLLVVPAEEGVLANDSDPDGDELTAILEDSPQFAEPGSFVLNDDGSFEYKFGGPSYITTDTFTYFAFDGNKYSELVTVVLSILTTFGEGIGLQKVTFVNDSNLSVYSDDGKTKYDQWQWLDWNADGDVTDHGDHTWPVLYPRTQKLRASSVTFIIDEGAQNFLQQGVSKARGQLQYGESMIEIVSAAGYTVNGKEVTFSTLTPTPASPAFDAVEVLNMMYITWEISGDGIGNWAEVATPSHNLAYITVAPAQQKPDHLYHSAVHIGTKACEGINTPVTDATVVSKVWDAFKAPGGQNPPPPNVKTWQNKDLVYYKTNPSDRFGLPQLQTTTALLTTQDGDCVAWTRLFIDVLRTQGTENQNDVLTISPQPVVGELFPEFFMIANWGSTLGNNPAVLIPGTSYNHRNFRADVEQLVTEQNGVWTYHWDQTRPIHLQDQPGVAGQSQPNPPSAFANHVVVKIGNALYDPSYGRPYANVAAFKAAMIQYFGIFRPAEKAFYFRPMDPAKNDIASAESEY
jgi:hypothetical protein